MSQYHDGALVSIGMPVHNEERHVAAALASLREQSYPNLEIVVSDNASADRTIEICRQHAAEDARIRVVRFEENRGATANFQHVLDQARGRYFLWASGHDLWSPNFVAECVALLESNDRACLAFASSNWIDADGDRLVKASGWTDTRGLGPVARYFTILWGNMHPILALMRTSELRACGPLPSMVGSDLVVLAALALRGDFVHATQATWSRREVRTEPRYGDKLKRYASPEFGITRSRFARTFPMLGLPIALMRIVIQSNIPNIDKVLTVIALMPSLALRYLVGRRSFAEEAKD